MNQFKAKVLTSALLVFGVLLIAPKILNSKVEPHPNDKISTHLLGALGKMDDTDTEGKSAIPVLVFLKKQGDITAAQHLPTREEKAKFVYDTLRQTALESQTDLVDFLKSRKVDFRRFYITNMVAIYNADPALVQQLAGRSDVARITGNPTIRNLLPHSELQGFGDLPSPNGIGQNITSTGADRVWSEFSNQGEGIVIAGQDTGVQWDHPALMKQYRGYSEKGVDHNYSWHDAIHRSQNPGTENSCGYDLAAPCDDDEHGTHTMGSMIGDDGAENKIGMAPKAKWIACRNMDEGAGTPASYIECFEYFLAPYKYGANSMLDGDPTKAPHVMNNSWGCPESEGCQGDEFIPVLNALKASGMMVVVSAGNEGPGCSTIQDQPAHHSLSTLSVGAHNHRTSTIAYFSSRGPSKFDALVGPDVTAPGVNIRSSVPGSRYVEQGWSGTSMAGPHVVGLVALMWSANPNLIGKIDETTDLIRKTATPKQTNETCGNIPGATIPNNTYGFGLINAYDAVKAVRQ